MNFYNLAFSEKRSTRIRRHFLFWTVWCFYWLTTYLIPTQWIPAWNLHGPMPQIEKYGFAISIFRVFMNTTLMTLILMGLTYGVLYYFLPRYLSKNRNVIGTTILLLLFVSFLAVINYLFLVLIFSISTQLGYFDQMPKMSFI